MGIKAILCHLDLGNSHIAAVVADTLVVGQQIFQNKTILNGTAAGLQAGHMAGLDGTHQFIHNGLQRLDLAGQVQIAFAECIGGTA